MDSLWNHSGVGRLRSRLQLRHGDVRSFISRFLEVLREGRRGGAREFYITGDLNVELGMMCTDEKDIEELNEMSGPLCWHGYEKDPGG